jgi:spermidine synthase
MVILFTTGFVSMGLEVVWTRAFTPVLHTTVYAFAYLVSVYLLATWVGSLIYRRDLSRNKVRSNANLIAWLAISVLLPVVINDPRINASTIPLLLSIFPVCGVLGYLTPKLIDTYSEGFAKRAGRAYAVNIVGCILGPLVSSYLLLPLLGSKSSMVLLSVPFLAFYLIYWRSLGSEPLFRLSLGSLATVLFISALLVNIGYEERFYGLDFSRDGVVRRDHTATIVSYGKGMRKRLYVNGIAITSLTTITKMMAHWPLAFLKKEPKKALVICFGMGTTFRSLMSWPIEVTAVELVPSVKDAFGYYFEDAEELLKDPRGKVVIDDGRRFLQRTTEKFDVITIDPPPPVEAAGSSFLYSRDFYEIVKSRLAEGGILHHWFPGSSSSDKTIFEGVARALDDAFPYVMAYHSVEGWGIHYLASMTPIDSPTVDMLVERIPPRAVFDILEWDRDKSLKKVLSSMLNGSTDIKTVLRYQGKDEKNMITDDRPINEYFKLRRFFAKRNSS